jgi:hypothetical protein
MFSLLNTSEVEMNAAVKKYELKAMPSLKSDEEAERFVESADLSEYGLSGFEPVKFAFEPKSAVEQESKASPQRNVPSIVI